MITTIDNARWHRATLQDGDDGVTIVIYRKLARDDNSLLVEIHREVIDAPFHLVCDYMHYEMSLLHNDSITSTPATLDKRVRSINGIRIRQ